MIIALTGYKQSGKSTVAKYLEENYGFVRVNFKDALVAEITQNFSDLLAEICCACDQDRPLPDRAWTEADLFELKPPLMRALMVNYGTEVRRKDLNDYWVLKWESAIAKLCSSTNIVVDDCRFLNEETVIRKHGGKVIRVFRTDIQTGGNHTSETEQAQIATDYVLESEPGAIFQLQQDVDVIMQNMLKFE